ncbi:MAG TPA: hypothetical protein VG675_03180 [Bryobacteraceae bacterium]|nr:hypothetical protein [Bryobacteraceae bacterium]
MTRRLLLFAPIASLLRADTAQDVWDLFTSLASALSEGNSVAFLKGFSTGMPGYEQLRADVNALLRQATVQSSIQFVKNDGDDQARVVEVDWFLQLVRQQDAAGLERRERHVTCHLKKSGKRWQIVALDPLSFFAPPKPA